jgi:hypothetical protein
MKNTLKQLKITVNRVNSYWTFKKLNDILGLIDRKYPRNSFYWRTNRKKKMLNKILMIEESLNI